MTRANLPPGEESLRVAAERQRLANDRLEATLGGATPLTNSQRLACCRELWKLHTVRGFVHMDQTVTEYERVARDAEALAMVEAKL